MPYDKKPSSRTDRRPGGYAGSSKPKRFSSGSKKPDNRAPRVSEEAVSHSPENENVIEGRNPVLEALKAGQPLDKLFIQKPTEGREDPIAARIAREAREAGAAVVYCDRRMLDRMSSTGAHQGVIAQVAAAAYVEISDILARAKERGRAPLVVVCDSINDPGNLGAIIRSAEIAGADGVIIPKRRSAGLTPAVYKASAGALSYMPVARTSNIVSALKELKEAGLWIFGTDASGDRFYYDVDLTVPCAIVIGSEGEGMSRLVTETCDILTKIPMIGHINSLNASAAAAVLLFESLKQRGL